MASEYIDMKSLQHHSCNAIAGIFFYIVMVSSYTLTRPLERV